MRRVYQNGRRVEGITERIDEGVTCTPDDRALGCKDLPPRLRKPSIHDPCGASSQIDQKLYLVVCSGSTLEVHTTTTILLDVGLVEEEDFWDDDDGDATVNYLKSLLGLSDDQVRSSKPSDSGTGSTKRAKEQTWAESGGQAPGRRRLQEGEFEGKHEQRMKFLIQSPDPCDDAACGHGTCVELLGAEETMVCECYSGWRASQECEGNDCPCMEQDCSMFDDACIACDNSGCLECNASLPFILENMTTTQKEDPVSGELIELNSTSRTCVDSCSQPPLTAGYPDASRVCMSCPPQCETCDADGCLSCRSIGRYPFKLANDCLYLCPDGYWSAVGKDGSRTCRPCDPSCETCFGPGSGSCLSCKPHPCAQSDCPDSIRPVFDVNASSTSAVGGSCVPRCPSGTFKDLVGPSPRGCHGLNYKSEGIDGMTPRHPFVAPDILFDERMRPENRPGWKHDPECREYLIRQAILERDVTGNPLLTVQVGGPVDGGGFQDGMKMVRLRNTMTISTSCENLGTCMSGCDVTCSPLDDPIWMNMDAHASEYYKRGGKCCNWEWPLAAQFASLGKHVVRIVNDPAATCSSCEAQPKGCAPPVSQSNCQPCHPACRECFGPGDHQWCVSCLVSILRPLSCASPLAFVSSALADPEVRHPPPQLGSNPRFALSQFGLR